MNAYSVGFETRLSARRMVAELETSGQPAGMWAPEYAPRNIGKTDSQPRWTGRILDK